jgi:mercuric ion transport protein
MTMGFKLASGERQKGLFAAVPVLGAALLPKVVCAACWPAYTAALGAAGIEFFNYTPYIVPLTSFALVVALGSLALLAWRRQRLAPIIFGLAAAMAIIVGKFTLESNLMLYAGLGTLMITSLFPWRSKAPACCT